MSYNSNSENLFLTKYYAFSQYNQNLHEFKFNGNLHNIYAAAARIFCTEKTKETKEILSPTLTVKVIVEERQTLHAAELKLPQL